MASSSAGSSTNGPKQGIPIIVQNALLGAPQTPLEDEANSEAEVEPGSSSDSMNVSSSTRVSVPGKMATSAFEIIAVEMQPDSASSPGNGNLHHSSLSLGGATNDTDQEQDFQLNGNGVASEEGLATESESETAPIVYGMTPANAVDKITDKSGSALIHRSPPQDSNNTPNSEALVTTTNLPPNVQLYSIEPPQSTVSVAPSTAVLPLLTAPVPVPPAPSISTIKTETGREITILKVEAEFRRGRWACSDYHDHRDTSPPPPNPSPAAGVIVAQTVTTQLNPGQTQAQQPQVVQQGPSHLPVLLEQQQQSQQNSVPQPGANSVMPPPPMGMTPMSLQQPRYPPSQQQTQQQAYSSTQQMVEKTAAALSRALSTDPAVYQPPAGGSFAGFSGHPSTGMSAPVMMPPTGTASAVVGGPPTAGFFTTGHVAPGGCVADLAAIENKVAQALDLVKKYLMAAVRHELEAMQGEVVDLQNRLEAVQRENELLRAKLPDDVLQNLLLAEQISAQPVSQMMQQQQQQQQQQLQPKMTAGTPLGAVPAMVDNPAISMATPPSPSFALSSTSPNNIIQPPKATSTISVVRQQQYYTQRERSPSANSVDMTDQRLNNESSSAGCGSGGSFDDSSSDPVLKT